MHARGSGEAARRAKRGRLAPSVTRVAICVSRVLVDGLQKKETARSLHVNRPYLRMRMQNVEEKKRIRSGETVQAD